MSESHSIEAYFVRVEGFTKYSLRPTKLYSLRPTLLESLIFCTRFEKIIISKTLLYIILHLIFFSHHFNYLLLFFQYEFKK